jgi:hypothetical protein
MAKIRLGRAGRVYSGVLFTAATLVGCNGSGSDTAEANPAGVTVAPTSFEVGSPTPTPTPTPTPSASSSPSASPAGTSESNPPGSGAKATHVALDTDFRLGKGRSAAVDGTDLVVTFTRLIRDSRCPTTVTCIVQGEAVIEVGIVGAGDTRSVRLAAPFGPAATGGMVPNEQRLGAYRIHLEAVEPWPVTATGPAGERSSVPMVAVLRVTRAE